VSLRRNNFTSLEFLLIFEAKMIGLMFALTAFGSVIAICAKTNNQGMTVTAHVFAQINF
jgi:hypothetical protein